MSRVIVIGASSGGVSALQRLAASLPADLPAPVVVVLHIGAYRSMLPELLSYRGPLPAHHAQDGEAVQPGRIYVAPPEHHLLLVAGTVRLTRGPKEHHARPAIDPLFLSAALSHGADVVGVVLTGMLDDGTFGLQAIKRCGGTAVVQDPGEAVQPSMPLSALQHVEVDHCVPLATMGALLGSLANVRPSHARAAHDESLRHEQAIMLFEGNGMEHLSAVATPSPFACPDCHGGLWEISGSDPLRFRCQVGHGFTIRSLQHAHWSVTDDAVWTALRALQEKSEMIRRMASIERSRGEAERAASLEEIARQIDDQCQGLHALTDKSPMPVE